HTSPLSLHDALPICEIDVAVAHLQQVPTHVESMLLLRDPFVVIVRRGHPLTAEPPSIEAYAAHPHTLVSPRGDTSGAIDRILVRSEEHTSELQSLRQ